MGEKQLYVVLATLSLLGTGAVLFGCAVAFAAIKATGEKRLAGWTEGAASWIFGGRGLARKILIVGVILAAGYSGALFAASLGSQEWNLEPGRRSIFARLIAILHMRWLELLRLGRLGRTPGKLRRGELFILFRCGRDLMRLRFRRGVGT